MPKSLGPKNEAKNTVFKKPKISTLVVLMSWLMSRHCCYDATTLLSMSRHEIGSSMLQLNYDVVTLEFDVATFLFDVATLFHLCYNLIALLMPRHCSTNIAT